MLLQNDGDLDGSVADLQQSGSNVVAPAVGAGARVRQPLARCVAKPHFTRGRSHFELIEALSHRLVSDLFVLVLDVAYEAGGLKQVVFSLGGGFRNSRHDPRKLVVKAENQRTSLRVVPEALADFA